MIFSWPFSAGEVITPTRRTRQSAEAEENQKTMGDHIFDNLVQRRWQKVEDQEGFQPIETLPSISEFVENYSAGETEFLLDPQVDPLCGLLRHADLEEENQKKDPVIMPFAEEMADEASSHQPPTTTSSKPSEVRILGQETLGITLEISGRVITDPDSLEPDEFQRSDYAPNTKKPDEELRNELEEAARQFDWDYKTAALPVIDPETLLNLHEIIGVNEEDDEWEDEGKRYFNTNILVHLSIKQC